MTYILTQVQPTTKVQLDYSVPTDSSGVALSAATWTDLCPNQTFLVDSASSTVEVVVDAKVDCNNASAYHVLTRVIVDSAGTSVTKMLGGMRPASGWSNPFAGGGTVTLSGLLAGTHTVKVQIYSLQSGTTYDLAVSAGNNWLNVRVLEHYALPAIASGPSATTKVQLDYNQAASTGPLGSGTMLSSNVWTDATMSQAFTVDDPNSIIEVIVGGCIQTVYATSAYTAETRLVVDAATYALGTQATAGTYANALAGANVVPIVALAAGSHTVKVQVMNNNPGTAACAGVDGVHVRVLERKQTPTANTTTALSPSSKVQLDYALSSDLNNVSLSAGVWTDLIANQTFTVDNANSMVEVTAGGNAPTGTTGSADVGSRLVIDSAGANIIKNLGGGYITTGINVNPLAGAAPVTLTGLSPGTHTVKLQVESDLANSLSCRPVTQAGRETCQIRVVEHYNIPSNVSGPQPTTKLQLNYNETGTLFSSSGVAISGWTDLCPNKSFIVDDPNSIVEVTVSGCCIMGGVTAASVGARIVVDSAGTAQNVMIGGGYASGGGYQNVLAGSTTKSLTGLSTGSHTVKVQVNGVCSAQCDPVNVPDRDSLSICVLERKQSAALVSNCMVKLAEVIVTAAAQATIQFSNIAQTYHTLRLSMYTRCDANVAVVMQLNADTGSNYDWILVQSNGSTSNYADSVGATSARIGTGAFNSAPANVFDGGYIEIPSYANSSQQKTWIGHYSHKDSTIAGNLYNEQYSGWWRSTAAITSILLFPASGNFVQGSVASLYGIL